MTKVALVAACAAIAACGRLDFDAVGDGGVARDTLGDASGGDASGTAPAFVQSNGCLGVNVNTEACPLAADATAGNTVILVFDVPAGLATTSVTDTAGDTYSVAAPFFDSQGARISTFYSSPIAASGPLSVTVQLVGAATALEVRIHEFSGIAASAAVDVAGQVADTGTAPVDSSGPALTTSVANELVFAYTQDGNGSAVTGPGWSTALEYRGDVGEYVAAATPGAYTPVTSIQTGTQWSTVDVAFFPR